MVKRADPAVQAGLAEAGTLAQILALDHAALLDAVLPEAPEPLRVAVRDAASLGILARMQAVGAALRDHLGPDACADLTRHRSDTVRGWGWFALVAGRDSTSAQGLIDLVLPAADDAHFGVREWAWLCVRERLAGDLNASIPALAALTADPSERIRRFACEALRPRGVWAKHIAALKTHPESASPILEPLRDDGSRYVQDSVGNWINDAAKSRPEWATALAARWTHESPTPATQRILRRGLRSL